MSKTATGRKSVLGILALCGILGPVIFVILMLVAASLYPGYSHARQAISELGGVEAPNPLIQNANFVIVGVLMVAFALGLHRGIGGGRSSILGPALLGIFGISGTIAQGFLPCDAGCEFESVTGTLHNLTGLTGFLAAIVGIFFTSKRLKGDPYWEAYRGYSLLTAAAAFVGLVAWIAIAKAAEVESLNGVLQRVFVAILLIWIEVVAIRLFWARKRAESYAVDGLP